MALKNNTKIDQIKSYLKKSNDYRYKDQMINFLKQNKNLPFNEDVLYDVLKIIIDNNLDFYTSINDAQKLYDTIVCDENNLEQYKMFLRIFPMHQQCDNNTTFKDANNFEIIYNMFENKKLLESIYKEIKDMNNTYYVYDYIIEARQYFVDEIAFYSSIMKFIISIKNNNIYLASEKEKFKEKQIENAKKMAGLYEINEQELEELPQKLFFITSEQNKIKIKLQEISKIVDNFLSKLDKDIENHRTEKKQDLQQIKNYVLEIENYTNEIKQNSNETSSNSKIDELIEQLMIYNGSIKKSQNNIVEEKSSLLIQDNETQKNNEEDDKFKYYAIMTMLEKIKKDMSDYINLPVCEFDQEMYNKIEKAIKLDYDKRTYNISDKDYEYLKYYYFALVNNSTDILGDLLSILGKIHEIEFDYLKKSVVTGFDKKTYLSLFPDRTKLISLYSEDIDLLNELLKENENFNIKIDSTYIKKLIEIFGFKTVANHTKIFKGNIKKIYNEPDELYLIDVYKEIYNVNPNFELGDYEYLRRYETLKNNNIFSITELVNLTKEQQSKIIRLLGTKIIKDIKNLFQDDTDIIIKYKEFIRNIVFNESADCYLNSDLLLLFEDEFTSPDKYILYDNLQSHYILRNYNALRMMKQSINGYNAFDISTAQKELKKRIKKENKKIKSK